MSHRVEHANGVRTAPSTTYVIVRSTIGRRNRRTPRGLPPAPRRSRPLEDGRSPPGRPGASWKKRGSKSCGQIWCPLRCQLLVVGAGIRASGLPVRGNRRKARGRRPMPQPGDEIARDPRGSAAGTRRHRLRSKTLNPRPTGFRPSARTFLRCVVGSAVRAFPDQRHGIERFRSRDRVAHAPAPDRRILEPAC